MWALDAIGRFAGSADLAVVLGRDPPVAGWLGHRVAMTVYARFLGHLTRPGNYLFGTLFVGLATIAAVSPSLGEVGSEQRRCRPDPAAGRSSRRASWSMACTMGYEGISQPLACTVRSGLHRGRTDPPLLLRRGGGRPPRPRRRCATRVVTSQLRSVGRGSARRLMYGLPILAVLVVLPTEQITIAARPHRRDARRSTRSTAASPVPDRGATLSGTGQSCSAG